MNLSYIVFTWSSLSKGNSMTCILYDAPTSVRGLNPPGMDPPGLFPPGAKSSGSNNPPGVTILRGLHSLGFFFVRGNT